MLKKLGRLNRKTLIFTAIFGLIVVILLIIAALSRSDFKTYDGNRFSIQYPAKFNVRSASFPDDPDRPGYDNVDYVTISPNRLALFGNNIAATAEPAKKTSYDKDATALKDQLGPGVSNFKLESADVGGIKGGVEAKFDQKGTGTKQGTTQNLYARVVKGNTLYTLRVTADKGGEFSRQLDKVFETYHIK
jgi:hypothetical protein